MKQPSEFTSPWKKPTDPYCVAGHQIPVKGFFGYCHKCKKFGSVYGATIEQIHIERRRLEKL